MGNVYLYQGEEEDEEEEEDEKAQVAKQISYALRGQIPYILSGINNQDSKKKKKSQP